MATYDTFDDVSDVLRTLVAALIAAGPYYHLDTEMMIRLWCAGCVRVRTDPAHPDDVGVEILRDKASAYFRDRVGEQ